MFPGFPGFVELLVILVIPGVIVWPFWIICTKAGFPGWYSLAMLIPCVGFLFPFFLAFAEWPSLKERPIDGRHS